MLIIPAIDLKNGLCVRLRQGRMDDATIFSENPIEIAEKWVNEGAKRLHLVDLDGAFAGKPVNQSVIQEISLKFADLPIQVGGGIRDLQTIENYLSLGVNFVIIGTHAVKEPEFVKQACQQFPGHIIVGIDAKNGKVATDGWANVSDIDAILLAKQFESSGVSAIVYTDISRDGMMQGVNIESTQLLAKAVQTPIIASGGITNLDDIKALCKITNDGVMGAITGRAIYEGTLDLRAAQALCDNN